MSRNVETVIYNGIKFRRYPDAECWADRVYFVSCHGARKGGIGRLHQEVWKDIHGPIPEGHDIHHRDGDPLNNDPDNLECITEAEHASRHSEQSPERLAWLRAWADKIRPLSKAWHSSEEGRQWHEQHARELWVDRPMAEYVCERCGKSYQSRTTAGQNRFCSNRCKAAARRASGVDDEDRSCVRCGLPFRVNRYSKVRYCGRSCSNSANARTMWARIQSDGSGPT